MNMHDELLAHLRISQWQSASELTTEIATSRRLQRADKKPNAFIRLVSIFSKEFAHMLSDPEPSEAAIYSGLKTLEARGWAQRRQRINPTAPKGNLGIPVSEWRLTESGKRRRVAFEVGEPEPEGFALA
jgi:hypothetical protein